MNSSTNGKKTVKQKIIAALLLMAMAAFALLSNGLIKKLNEREGYSDWLKTAKEPNVLIIDVWHIVSFKPYIGSLGSWLKARADEYKKSYTGIHFEVKSLTPYQAEQLLSRGMQPDVISFSYGDRKCEELYRLDGLIAEEAGIDLDCGTKDGALYALPYCASGCVLIYDPIECAGLTDDELMNNAGTAAEFKKGKALSCICDLKAAGDIYRAGLAGSAPYFEAKSLPFDNEAEELVQFAGISNGIDPRKLKYALGFIEYITNKTAQDTLCEQGILPVRLNSKAAYEQPWIKEIQIRFDIFDIKNCFDCRSG